LPLRTEELSKAVSHALRHEPWVYELELDAEGWAPVSQLLDALQQRGGAWSQVDRQALVAMIESSDKRRHELIGDRIRALYGHSLPNLIERKPVEPPELLFHGTTRDTWEKVRVAGLSPMGRQYVHLSIDVETALASPIVLHVAAADAARLGTKFYEGNSKVWLADYVPAQFICCR
jgi:putative RNA 2'-phosphotransferase